VASNSVNTDPGIVERYGNSQLTPSIIIGFDAEGAEYITRKILDNSGDWTAWERIGDWCYDPDKSYYAGLEGCPFKLDNTTSDGSPAAGTDG